MLVELEQQGKKVLIMWLKLWLFVRYAWKKFVELHVPFRLDMPYIAGAILVIVGTNIWEDTTSTVYNIGGTGVGLTTQHISLLLILGGTMYAVSNAHGLVAFFGWAISMGLYGFLAIIILTGGGQLPDLLGFPILSLLYMFRDLKGSIVAGIVTEWVSHKINPARGKRTKIRIMEQS